MSPSGDSSYAGNCAGAIHPNHKASAQGRHGTEYKRKNCFTDTDVNADSREQMGKQCMYARGWQLVEVKK